ncbi:hypothetical protein GFS31_43880 (plasmid) [Leptolyngbya sp. BL0902]|nr:hypothetical protein GFS31_43880 [Leptolyngbya sp. BL0902]
MFQSLRGFGVDWSPPHKLICNLLEVVSIPERVWGGLELLCSVAPCKLITRFNP